MNGVKKLQVCFHQLAFQDCLLIRNISTSLYVSQYNGKPQPAHTKDETEVMLKATTAAPQEMNPVVAEAEDPIRVQAANSFYSTSIFQDELVSKFVNCMMYDGKKNVSQRVMEDTFEQIKKIQLARYHKVDKKDEIELDPLKVFHTAIANVKPVLGVQTMKKKGKKLQVPYPLPDNRRRFLAIKWLLTTARSRPGNAVPMSDKLSKEILDAYKKEGTVIQKKIDYHKRAELLRAFAHYRWW